MTENVITIRDKINEKMDKLEWYIASNYHYTQRQVVREHLKEIHKYYTFLELEDQRYVDAVDDYIGRDDNRWY